MNYRHAFHAGNFADVMKHVMLVRVLCHLRRKDKPFAPDVEHLLAPYREVLQSTRQRHGPHIYPGSPFVIRELMRKQDRAVLAELHPADGALLTERFNAVANMKVLHLDGWTALH